MYEGMGFRIIQEDNQRPWSGVAYIISSQQGGPGQMATELKGVLQAWSTPCVGRKEGGWPTPMSVSVGTDLIR